jgi:hypothetical protein
MIVLTNAAAWKRGASLAFDLLEAAKGDFTHHCISSEDRGGRPQTNIVLSAMARVNDANDTRVRRPSQQFLPTTSPAARQRARRMDRVRWPSA